jgi:hypothetical protein
MDGLFEFLFKYRPLVFEQGDFAFTAPASVRLWILTAGLVGLVAVASYTVARGKAGRGERAVMATLRVALLGILVFALLHPALILSTVVPQQNFLGILVDDSRSMQLADVDGRPRSDFVAQAFTPGESELLRELADRFTLRFFRFSSATARMDDLAELTY